MSNILAKRRESSVQGTGEQIAEAVRSQVPSPGSGGEPADDTAPGQPTEGAAPSEGSAGQNIAPTKKRGAFRAAVGGANSIRI